MAGLRVFVSSTCVDLGAQRAQVRSLLERMGYEPVMSEHSDVLFDHRMHTHTSCIKEISNADMVILLIGSRFGGTATPEALTDLNLEELSKSSTKTDFILDKHRLSITQVEVLKAIETDVPLFAFVDAKVYSDHHLYLKNKDQPFSDQILYPSIEKSGTAKYIFEFISFITHRFSNNAITAYSAFTDIEDHLIKQWSMTFQRLLRDERDKSVEGRRADAILEQVQDLKAVVLQSIGAGAGRDIARSVLRFRRLADFLLGMRLFKPDVDLVDYQGSFDELLALFGVTDVRMNGGSGSGIPRVILVREDGTHVRVRIPDRRFLEFAVEWKRFSGLERETKAAVLAGVEDAEAVAPPIFHHVLEPYEDEDGRIEPFSDGEGRITTWTEDRIALLKELWVGGLSASQIASTLGGVTRNAVIAKVHRLGLTGRSAEDGSGTDLSS